MSGLVRLVPGEGWAGLSPRLQAQPVLSKAFFYREEGEEDSQREGWCLAKASILKLYVCSLSERSQLP